MLLCAAFFLCGCEDSGFDHTPPAGKGAIVVDNKTFDTLLVYINGRSVFEVSDYDHELLDLAPGVYRLVIDQKHGYHSYSGDMDVLEGQLTVFEVKGYHSGSSYDVRTYYD